MHSDGAPGLRIAFMTGRSDRRRCGLSPQQQVFLNALRAPGRSCIERNFPYAAPRPGHAPVALPVAAMRNAGDFLAAQRPAFAARFRQQVECALEGPGPLVLLAGSCGLQLLAGLRLAPALRARLHVFAYGPVARQAPEVARLLCVRGRGDWISRLGWRGPVQQVAGGHMDYLQQPEVLALCEAFIRETPCAST